MGKIFRILLFTKKANICEQNIFINKTATKRKKRKLSLYCFDVHTYFKNSPFFFYFISKILTSISNLSVYFP